MLYLDLYQTNSKVVAEADLLGNDTAVINNKPE